MPLRRVAILLLNLQLFHGWDGFVGPAFAPTGLSADRRFHRLSAPHHPLGYFIIMFLDPFMTTLGAGLKLWPVSEQQLAAEREERCALDRHYQNPTAAAAPNPRAASLMARRALPAGDGRPAQLDREGLAHRSPARRAVFRLLGAYFPEPEAREILQRIHDHKWIEAEKAGFDIWRLNGYEPLKMAAETWAQRHLPATVLALHNQDDEVAA